MPYNTEIPEHVIERNAAKTAMPRAMMLIILQGLTSFHQSFGDVRKTHAIIGVIE